MGQVDYSASVITAANTYGVDPNLALAVMQTESGGNPNAISPVGAVGLFQLMPSSFPGQDINDPITNINLGVQYLAKLINQFGNVDDALAAYNWGPGNMTSYINNGVGITSQNMPMETSNYIQKVNDAWNSLTSAVADTINNVGDSVGGIDPTLLVGFAVVGIVGAYFLMR